MAARTRVHAVLGGIALTETEKRTEVVEQSADTVVITTRDGSIEYANQAMLKLTGYTREEVIGRTPAILKSGEKRRKQSNGSMT